MKNIKTIALILIGGTAAFAQTNAAVRGKVELVKADGTKEPVVGALPFTRQRLRRGHRRDDVSVERCRLVGDRITFHHDFQSRPLWRKSFRGRRKGGSFRHRRWTA